MGSPEVPWNQARVRMSVSGKKEGTTPLKHGCYWSVKVVTPGTYEISALRWPEEANHPITAPLPPGEDVPGASKAFRAYDGFALPATAATLRIDGKDLETKPVGTNDTMITFTTDLEAGTRQLAPIFQTKFGEVGAYYTIVTKK